MRKEYICENIWNNERWSNEKWNNGKWNNEKWNDEYWNKIKKFLNMNYLIL